MSSDTGFDCPRCGKKGFVRLHSDGDVFECLYCGFSEDLSQQGGQGDLNWFFASLLAIFIALAILAG